MRQICPVVPGISQHPMKRACGETFTETFKWLIQTCGSESKLLSKPFLNTSRQDVNKRFPGSHPYSDPTQEVSSSFALRPCSEEAKRLIDKRTASGAKVLAAFALHPAANNIIIIRRSPAPPNQAYLDGLKFY
jgi:hypothetical protein